MKYKKIDPLNKKAMIKKPNFLIPQITWMTCLSRDWNGKNKIMDQDIKRPRKGDQTNKKNLKDQIEHFLAI